MCKIAHGTIFHGWDSGLIGRQLRTLRKRQGLTLQQLGETAGLSAAFLSQVERELTSLSVSSLASIANALNVPPSFFFPHPKSDSVAVRSYEREPFRMDRADVVYARLGHSFEGRQLEPLFVTYPANYRSETSSHVGEEFYFVITGQLTVLLDGEPHKLNEGDSIHFLSDSEHQLINPSDVPVQVVVVNTPTLLS